jgi:hypothetical protein
MSAMGGNGTFAPDFLDILDSAQKSSALISCDRSTKPSKIVNEWKRVIKAASLLRRRIDIAGQD